MNLSARRIGGVTAAAAVVLVLVWYLALFRPESSHLKAAHAQYTQATAQISKLQAEVRGLEALESQIPADKSKLAALTAALPRTSDLQDALNQLHGLATGTGVQLSAVNPTPDVGGTGTSAGGVSTVRMSLNLSGGYSQTMGFITGLDQMTRTVVVDSATFGSTPDGNISTSLNARIFYAP